jgi:hypothetical protein
MAENRPLTSRSDDEVSARDIIDPNGPPTPVLRDSRSRRRRGHLKLVSSSVAVLFLPACVIPMPGSVDLPTRSNGSGAAACTDSAGSSNLETQPTDEPSITHGGSL